VSAKIVVVGPYGVLSELEPERLWFFPDASDYLRYSPHYHLIMPGGFRQNLPLVYNFVAVMEGKLSVKDYWGQTINRISVRDQVWYLRGTQKKTPEHYAHSVINMDGTWRRRKEAR
jgi:hypothetical protein